MNNLSLTGSNHPKWEESQEVPCIDPNKRDLSFLHADVRPLVFSRLSKDKLFDFRACSVDCRKMANDEFVRRLNNNEMFFSSLGLEDGLRWSNQMNAEKAIKFLGESCFSFKPSIFSKIPLRYLQELGEISIHCQQLAYEEIVRRFLKNRNWFLGLDKFVEIVEFLEKNDSKINLKEFSELFLEVNISSRSLGDLLLTRVQKSITYRKFANDELVRRLNNKKISLYDLGINKNIKNVVEFFGESCLNLTRLDLEDVLNYDVEMDYSLLVNFPNLKFLALSNGKDFLNNMQYYFLHCGKVEELMIREVKFENVKDFSLLANLPNLQEQSPSKVTLEDLLALRNSSENARKFVNECLAIGVSSSCYKLEDLGISTDITSAKEIIDFFGEDNAAKITGLDLSNYSQLTDLKPLSVCANLSSVSLSHNFDLSFLQHYPKLSCLRLNNWMGDLTPLKNFPNIKMLLFIRCKEISSDPQQFVNFLKDYPNIRDWFLCGCEWLTQAHINAARSQGINIYT
jgi:hypothetical protein